MTASNPNGLQTLLITGGGGYVGSALVPYLLDQGYAVRVVDLFWYGKEIYGEHNGHPNLTKIPLDIRNASGLREVLPGTDAVLHLACISNDPSFELDADLGRSINYEAFGPLLQASVDCGVKRFIYASSSSVYGLKEEPNVRETAELAPLTDYSKFKLACERDLLAHPDPKGMERVILRPATVCGYAHRLRLDLTVNILTAHALVNRKIRIFGGKQLRPNINIQDMIRAYEALLLAPGSKIDGEAFNAGFQNRAVEDIAHIVRDTVGDEGIDLAYEHSDDNRSYHINSDKIDEVLGFRPQYTIEDAVQSLVDAFAAGKVSEPMTNPLYYNIRRMQQLGEA